MGILIYDLLTVVGALGLFLIGMKMVSEALQKIAGSKMRSLLSAKTSNPVIGVLVGFLVTVIIQSSSATTVMVVSFVNAGLMSLFESISVIMGANIGTTITGWIIALLGFKIQMSTYSLPLIAVGLMFIFSRNANKRSWGEFLVGFALLFLGLHFLKGAISVGGENSEVFGFVKKISELGFYSTLLYVLFGAILTVLIQSSSATLVFTFVLCVQAWIPFYLAAAMVLGENVGTTVTANWVAREGNISAKRAARVHLVFNLVGVAWMLMVFPWFIEFIECWILNPMKQPDSLMLSASKPLAISIFHTSFNLLNVLLFIWFIPSINRFLESVLPFEETEKEEFRLKYISTGMLSTPELSIVQARKEVNFFGKHTRKMFTIVRELMRESDELKAEQVFKRIQKYENICDNIEIEIANYLTQVSQGKLSDSGRRKSRAMLRLIDDLESIGDHNYNLAKVVHRMRAENIVFSSQILGKIELMFDLVEESLLVMWENLVEPDDNINLIKAKKIEEEINKYRNQLKLEHLDNLKNDVYKYDVGIMFNDLFSECEKLADYIINVSEALYDIKN